MQATYNIKTEKKIDSTYLMSVRCGRLAEGKGHETQKRSFNLSCVLDLFSERWQSTLFQIFYFFISRAVKTGTGVNHMRQ